MSVGRILHLFLLAGIGCCAGCRPSPPAAPTIHDYSDTHYTTGAAWFEFKHGNSELGDTGWVLLPEPVDEPPFRSGVDPFKAGFVRPEVCGECHRETYESFVQTAHFRTAEEASRETVLGRFSPDDRLVTTRDPKIGFEMVDDDRGLWQRLIVRDAGQEYTHEAPIDIVTGSGNHGQTYLYWHGDELYQLPISYFSEVDRWVNSPGLYADGTADFARGIGDRCLDCHATFFAQAPGSFNRYDRTNYVLGVTCVRCHGPGWSHVQYHRHNPEETEAQFIVHPGALGHERANEVCTQCHSGAGQLQQRAFSYHPGEPLSEYVQLNFDGNDPHNDDPHAANQLARLMKSRCFTESGDLTCFTCHNPHVHERGHLSLFARRCATCHEVDDCGLSSELGGRLETHCVQCHMPSRRDAHGVIETNRGAFLPLLRDHLIQAKPPGLERLVEELRETLRDDARPPTSDP